MTPVAAAIRLGVTPMAIDERGVPQLLRSDSGPAMSGGDVKTVAQMHVQRLAPAWGVKSAAMPALESVGEAPLPGVTIVRLRQVIDGMPVDGASGGEVRVMVRPDNTLVAASGKLISADTPRPAKVNFIDDEAGAIARAVADVYGKPVASASFATKAVAADGGRMLAGTTGSVNVSLARAQKVWFPAGETLIAAYRVEAYASTANSVNGDAFARVIAADDGRVLKRVNLTADAAYSYRVYAETTGELHPFDGPIADSTPNATGVPNTTPYPPFVAPNLVTVDGLNHPFTPGGAAADPWLTAGSTETNGNNVQAYTDVNAPDGLSFGDFRATVTSAGAFDRTEDFTQGPLASQSQQMVGVTELFYLINWLHDFWYDAGFTEPTGNAQNNNFGRGGQDRDAINAEAQDDALGGSRNNANMSTPSDGLPPRMQVFVWDGKQDRSIAISGRSPTTNSAGFGPASFNITAPVVVASDGTGVASDACEPLTAPATGQIVLADRGGCTFKTKVLNAQNAGAVGVIIANNAAAIAAPALGDDANITTPITIGVLSVLQSEGVQIKADIAAAGGNPVNATLRRGPAGPDLDGSLDASVIAHEFMHYVHHRLSACDTSLCGAMSEGWADFDALLVVSRAGDNLNKAFPMGVFSTMGRLPDPVYFGIRRAPYSVDPKINPLSFRHMADGTPLPTDVPFNPSATNSEVHAAGEVWASMLWEGYVALQKLGAATGQSFNDVRLKMRQYVVAGLLMAPTDATPTETRDAILIAARAVNKQDHDALAAAYARRGFGSCAVSPSRNSVNFVGIVESNEIKGRIQPGAMTSALSAVCDNDGVLDAGETMQVSVPVSNGGPVPLSNVNIKVSTAIPGLHVSPAAVAVGTLDPYAETTVSFTVSLDAAVTGALSSDLQFEVSSTDGCANVSVPVIQPFNTDDKPASSATETFDAVGTVWTTTGSPSVWSHVRETGLDGMVSGADRGFVTDASLVSPPITAGPGNLTISFTHRFSFEITPASGATPAQPFDGGVIEFSTDGALWSDISLIANPGYTQTLVANGDNPLRGRRAFGGTNPSFPSADSITMFLGTRLAGKTFQLRFRSGTDSGGGSDGWQIDDISFKGIVGTPFPTLVPDTTSCTNAAPPAANDPSTGGDDDGATGTDDDGSAGTAQDGTVTVDPSSQHSSGGCQVGGGALAGGNALLLGLAAVLLRRRRR